MADQNKNRFLIPILLISIALLPYHGWLKPGVIARTDLYLPSGEWLEDNLSLPQLWDEEGGGRVVAIYEAQDYLYFLWAFLHQKMGISIDLGRRIIWFFPFFVGLYSMYSLMMLLFQNRIASIISSLYFVASSMTLWAAHVSWIQGITGLSLAPLVFAFFVKAIFNLQNGRFLRNCILGGFTLSVIIWYDMKIALLTCGLVSSFAIFHLFRELYTRYNHPEFKIACALRILLGLGILATIPIVLNLYTILPHILLGASGSPAASSQPAYLNVAGSGSIAYSVLLVYKAAAESKQVFIPFLAIISATAFLAVLLRNRCPWVTFFALVSVILIFLSKQTEPPLANFNFYLYNHIPGFAAFRDPTKFLVFQTVPISILLGVSVSELCKRLSPNKKTINL